ncbi:MAG TPA: hypothetical protein VJS69_05405 [Candidatus Krumholzibacteria bacterium]|nr:hypothetical protein [Candidatus Krumholzibacteria bacterium]
MNLQQALDDPSSVFAAPADVVRNEDVSREQKIQILRRWEYEARTLEVAQDENMMGGVVSRLAEVLDALHSLGEQGQSGAINMQGEAPEDTTH